MSVLDHWLEYYRRQRLAGKLNLLFLSLFTVLLLNVFAVFVSLSMVYTSNAALWKLERFESRVGAIERTLLRFRISHERGDALAVRDLMASAGELLAGIPGRVFVRRAGEEDNEVLEHMRGFAQRLNEYLYFHEQVRALESGMRKASDELQESVRGLRAEPVPARLDATVARLSEAALEARLAQQEYILSRDVEWVQRLRTHLNVIVREAGALRQQSPVVETQIVAYSIAQDVQVLRAAFERFAELTRRKIDNENEMLQVAARIVERVGEASDRQRTGIARQIMWIATSMVLAGGVVLVLWTLLGRRFVQGLTRPLTELVEMSGSLARGDYARRIEVRAPDELGDLAQGFNVMAATVQGQIETLRATDRELRARTAQLETANAALGEAKTAAEALSASLEVKVRERTEALETANRQLTELTVTDALTGLANRRHFDLALVEEWARAQRSGQPLALLMVDVDFFKPYNDHYGHQAGDDCLRRVAHFLRGAARRAGDLVARYGGEEFAVVAADTDLAAALSLAEAMRATVAAAAIPHAVTPVAGGTATVSIGVAVTVPKFGETPERLLLRADAALYLAKSQGRNRVAQPDEFLADEAG
ncbi:MAG: diguanylate cyclase [Propionivibrio sp.]